MLQFILFFLSLGLFIFSPDTYNPLFCGICFAVFCFTAIPVLKKDIKEVGLVNFNLLFLFSFFLCSYAFVVFIYPYVGDFKVSRIANPEYFSKCISLCTLAISSYGVGYFLLRNRTEIIYEDFDGRITRESKLLYGLLLPFVIFILVRFLSTSHDVEIEVQDSPFLFVLVISVLAVYFASSTHDHRVSVSSLPFFYGNAFVIISLGFILVLYLIIGDRLFIVESICILLSAYSIFYKRIKWQILLVLVVFGVVLMSVVRVTRTGDSSLREGDFSAFVEEGQTIINNDSDIGAWSYFTDLTNRYSELCGGYEYTVYFGHQYPLKIIAVLFSPFPVLPNVVNSFIYGVPLSATSPGRIVARHTMTNAGSHCVISAYMPWGAIGVILLFFLFGLIIAGITNHHRHGIIGASFYLTVMAYSIFIPRSSLLDIYRPLTWTFFVIVLLSRIRKIK